MPWDWNGVKPNQFPLIFSPKAAGSHSKYFVESGLNSSTPSRNKHQHSTRYKLCKHISICRIGASKTRFEKWKEQRDTASKIACFSIMTCSHNSQLQHKAAAVVMLIAWRKATTCTLTLSALCQTRYMAENVQQFKLLFHKKYYEL